MSTNYRLFTCYISVAHAISEGAVKPLDSEVTTRNGSEQDVAVLPSTEI